MTTASTTGRSVAWGRETERSTINGHDVLVYATRPVAVGDFLVTARRWGDREFLVQGERRLTYTQHEQAVAAVAHHLLAKGVRPGHSVTILGFNSIEWIVTYWAVHAIGATAVLGNAWWSDHEVEQSLAQSGSVLAITDREVGLPRVGFVELREVVDASGEQILELPVPPADEDALASIIFSSGTTGAPKGVLMSQRSVIANIHNMLVLTGRLPDELPADRPGSVSMLTVPLFHLSGVQVCSLSMLSGGRLVLLEGKFDAAEVLRLIEEEKVRSWGSIPTMVSRVLDHPDMASRDTSSLRSIPMGGSPVPADLRERIKRDFESVRSGSSSLYGLTEAGGVLAAGSGKDVAEHPGCVGRALPVVELRVMSPDETGSGEILARTPTATEGYLGDRQGVTDADGWITTGDLGRIDEDGWLYLTGRSKDIIIRGGENIAIVNVENALQTHPDVLEVCVVGLPHDDLGEEVGAAVTLRPGAEVTPEGLTEHVVSTLARYERPTQWRTWEGPLPTNASGKILRRVVAETWAAESGETTWTMSETTKVDD